MEAVLEKRHRLGISRRGFLIVWGNLRKKLSATAEYRKWVEGVRASARNCCEAEIHAEDCGGRGEVAHHVVPVARNPKLALDKKNGRWVSRACHAQIHPHLNYRRRK